MVTHTHFRKSFVYAGRMCFKLCCCVLVGPVTEGKTSWHGGASQDSVNSNGSHRTRGVRVLFKSNASLARAAFTFLPCSLLSAKSSFVH